MTDEIRSLHFENVDPILRRLQSDARGAAGQPVVLDLQQARSVERSAASVLSAALLGSLGDVPLEVRLPENAELRRRMAWSSLAFAFANRKLAPTFVGGRLELAGWKRSWSPGTRSQFDRPFKIGELFDPAQLNESADEPTTFGRSHAAFVNPHRAAPTPGASAVTTVVRPWLSRVLPAYLSERGPSEEARAFLKDVGDVIDELLENVREHAAVPNETAPTKSLVHVSITRGGGEASSDRFYLTVLDTGPGIATTARPKLDLPSSEIPGGALVKGLLEGRYSGWGRARGLGLPRVWKRVSVWHDATLKIATNAERLSADARGIRVEPVGFDIHGTVIVFMVPLPPARGN